MFGHFFLRHLESVQGRPHFLRREQMEMRAKRGVDLVVNFVREDLLATGLTDGNIQFGDRECVQAPVVPYFGLVAQGSHEDLILAALTAPPRKWPFSTERAL
jgi:hypothetical protein